MKHFDPEILVYATYTIRRLGCAAWTCGVKAVQAAEYLAIANDAVPGHILVGEDGEVEGKVIAVKDIERALREMEG